MQEEVCLLYDKLSIRVVDLLERTKKSYLDVQYNSSVPSNVNQKSIIYDFSMSFFFFFFTILHATWSWRREDTEMSFFILSFCLSIRK